MKHGTIVGFTKLHMDSILDLTETNHYHNHTYHIQVMISHQLFMLELETSSVDILLSMIHANIFVIWKKIT